MENLSYSNVCDSMGNYISNNCAKSGGSEVKEAPIADSSPVKNYKIISIEGNIGSGKTTLLTELKEKYKNDPRIVFLKEPVDEWETIKDKTGKTMIQKFYENQEMYSFSFQMMAYISRLALLKQKIKEYKNEKNMIFITERSLYTDKYVFAKMLFESGKIEDVNYQIYGKWFDLFALEDDCRIDKIIYVKVDPTICMQRITGRGRSGESNIPLEYLSSCHDYHENMMQVLNYVDMLILDGKDNVRTLTKGTYNKGTVIAGNEEININIFIEE